MPQVVLNGESGIDVYFHYQNAFKAPKFTLEIIGTGLGGCEERIDPLNEDNVRGYCEVSWIDFVGSEQFYLFNSPPPYAVKTVHKVPQLNIIKNEMSTICEVCDLNYITTKQIPKVSFNDDMISDANFNFYSCLASFRIDNDHIYKVDLVNNLVSFFI